MKKIIDFIKTEAKEQQSKGFRSLPSITIPTGMNFNEVIKTLEADGFTVTLDKYNCRAVLVSW